MRVSQRYAWCACLMALTLMPEIARAQTAASSFDLVAQTLKPGQRIAVTTADGRETNGNVAEISPSSITLTGRDKSGIDQRRSFDQSTVIAIRRADRLWNGFLIGLGAGLAANEVFVHKNCGPRGNDDECRAIVNAIGWVTFVPGGALAGALIDKVIGNDLVYRSGGARSTIQITPQFGRARTALSVSVGF